MTQHSGKTPPHPKKTANDPGKSGIGFYAVVAAAALIIAILFINNSFGIRDRLNALFARGDPGEEDSSSLSVGLPSMTALTDAEPEREFFSITADDALDNLVPAPFYTRRFTVTYGWEGRTTERNWTLDAAGECWRLSDPPDEIFCDGSRIYAYVAGYASVSEGTSWEPEVGAGIIEEISRRSKDRGTEAEISVSASSVTVRLRDEEHLSDYYEIDVESGLILTEQRRYDDAPIRSIVTQSLTLPEGSAYREEYDERVRDFLAAHPEREG